MIRTVKPPSDQRSANGALGPSASHDHYSGGKRFLAAHPVSCLAEPGNDSMQFFGDEPEPSIPAKL